MPPRTKKTETPAAAQNPNAGRAVKYPEITVEKYLGDRAMNAEFMRELLGWEVEPDGADWGSDYLLADNAGKKVRCRNGARNRPYTDSHARSLMQDMLNRNWADSRNTRPDDPEPMTVNGETIVVNRYGDVGTGNHRLVGGVLADQVLRSDSKAGEHWRAVWGERAAGGFTMEAIVVYGVSGSHRVSQTWDNTRPRTAADVIYMHRDLFGDVKIKEAKILAKYLEFAVRQVWYRTGHTYDAFSKTLTNSEVMGYVRAHPRLLEAVKVMAANNKDGRFAKLKLCGVGTMAGMLYLMAASATTPEAAAVYRTDPVEPWTEKHLDLSRWDAAVAFAAGVTRGDEEFKGFRKTLAGLADEEGDTLPSKAEIMAVIVNSWNEYADGGPRGMTPANLKPTFDAKQNVEMDSVGGIDQGDPDEAAKEAREEAKKAAKEAAEAEKRAADEAARKEKTDDLHRRLDAAAVGHEGEVLLFKGDKCHVCWRADAADVSKVIKVESYPDKTTDTPKAVIPEHKLKDCVAALVKVGRTVTEVVIGGNEKDGSDRYSVLGRPEPKAPPVAVPAPSPPTPAVSGGKGKPSKAKASAGKAAPVLRGGTSK